MCWALLEYAIKEEKIIDKMSQDEICRLILFSPFNLHNFFDYSVTIQEKSDLPKFANLNY